MSEKNILSFSGLHTSANGFGSVPDGALVEANNVQIVQKNVLEPRRGREPLVLDDLILSPDQIFYHEGTPIVHGMDLDDNKVLAALPTDGTVTFFTGTYEAPDRASGRIKSVSADTRTYFTSGEGVFRLESAASTPILAGAPQTADIYNVLTSATTNGFLGVGNTCAYRVVFGKEDANENLILGAPGGRAFAYVVSTDTDSHNTAIEFPVPVGATTDDFYQIYRSVQVTSPIVPEDSLFLVIWKNFTAAEIVAGAVTAVDDTPDSLLGEPLYTNPTAEGILQANDLPPLAKDIALWSERLWYGNTTQAQNLEVQLLGVGEGADGSTGVRVGDQITIAGQTYTGAQPGYTPTNYFSIYNSYVVDPDATPSSRIEKTARDLVRAVNANTSNTLVDAYYLSGPDDLPGKMLIRARTKQVAEFYATLAVGTMPLQNLTRAANVVTALFAQAHGFAVGDTFILASATPNANFPVGTKTVASVASAVTLTYTEVGANAGPIVASSYTATRLTPIPSFAWNPELPTSGTSVASDNDAIVHRLYYSKYQEYEAVPTLNYLDVGVKKKAILRIYPLADMLVVFKEDGIYAVSGDTAPWSIRLIDETVKLIAPDTLAKVRGKLLGLTNQGVVAINANGYDIVSGPIENVFVRLAKPDTEAYASVKRNSFAFGRDTDRLYVLYPISDLGATHQTAYVYNVLFGCWTTWDGDTHGCAAVNPTTDALYIGRVDDVNTILKERRSLTEQDYYDASVEATIEAITPGTGSVVFDTDMEALGVVPGALAYTVEHDQDYVIVQTVVGNTVTVYGNFPEANVSETVVFYLPFTTTVKFNTVLGGSPNQLKQFSEFKLHWKSKYNYHLSITTSSDLDPTEQTLELTDDRFDITDSLDWGVWTEPVQDRDLVPAAHQKCTYFHFKLTIQEAQSYWQLNGMSLTYVPGSTATMY